MLNKDNLLILMDLSGVNAEQIPRQHKPTSTHFSMLKQTNRYPFLSIYTKNEKALPSSSNKRTDIPKTPSSPQNHIFNSNITVLPSLVHNQTSKALPNHPLCL